MLSREVVRNGCMCYAWALMPNHYHLVLRCSEKPLKKMMRALNSNYAKKFNKKHGRHGYVFQGRYKSIITQDQNYLKELIRSVHLNPLRADICKSLSELERYQWCGHGASMGRLSNSFQATQSVFKSFGTSPSESRRAYREFLRKGIDTCDEQWLVTMVGRSNAGIEKRDRPECWVIGDRDFVVSVMKKNQQRLALSRKVAEQWNIGKVLSTVCAENQLPTSEVLKRHRGGRAMLARKKFIYIACRILGFPVASVASFPGVSSPSVSWAINKGEQIFTKAEIRKFTILPPG
jgi:REP element-mobilizing transposase RayT